MASTMASTFALSRPSEKFGTHSTNVFATDERINQQPLYEFHEATSKAPITHANSPVSLRQPEWDLHLPGSILKVAIAPENFMTTATTSPIIRAPRGTQLRC